METPEQSLGNTEREPAVKIEEVAIPDSQGFKHEATLVRPESENGLMPAVLTIGGIPPNSHNTDSRPFDFHPFFGVVGAEIAKHHAYAMGLNPAGMGHSEGDTWDESLQTRIDSWAAAAKWLVENTNTDPARLRIIGSSMGAHVALRLVEKLAADGITVDRLALISPAAYSSEAEDISFRVGWKNLPKSDPEDSPAIKALDDFNGKLLMSFVKDDKPVAPVQPTFEKRYSKVDVAYAHPNIGHGFKVDGAYDEPTMAEASQTISRFLTEN